MARPHKMSAAIHSLLFYETDARRSTGLDALNPDGLEFLHLSLGVPITFVLATQTDIYRKPNAGMWNFLVEHLSPGVKP
eukprot:scaffold37274_cov18-Tisochrysis_lutea.AAC.2